MRYDPGMAQTNRTFMSIREVAFTLGVSPSTAYSWAERGVLPTVEIAGRVRIPRRALEEWCAAREAEALRRAA